jgi:hypothetical protein
VKESHFTIYRNPQRSPSASGWFEFEAQQKIVNLVHRYRPFYVIVSSLDRICIEDVDITLKKAVDLAGKYEIKLKMDSHPGNSQFNKIQQSHTRTPNVTNSEGQSTSKYKPSW